MADDELASAIAWVDDVDPEGRAAASARVRAMSDDELEAALADATKK